MPACKELSSECECVGIAVLFHWECVRTPLPHLFPDSVFSSVCILYGFYMDQQYEFDKDFPSLAFLNLFLEKHRKKYTFSRFVYFCLCIEVLLGIICT